MILVKNCCKLLSEGWKGYFRDSKFQNLPWGMPPDPPRSLRLQCSVGGPPPPPPPNTFYPATTLSSNPSLETKNPENKIDTNNLALLIYDHDSVEWSKDSSIQDNTIQLYFTTLATHNKELVSSWA